MNDDEMLSTMRSSLTGIAESLTDVHLEQPVSTIHARARDHRLRRGLAGLAGVATAGLALSLGLALAAGGSSGASRAKAPGSIRTASFTLVSHHNGTATLTINTCSTASPPGMCMSNLDVLLDTTALQNDLQQDGIPALVTSGNFCSSDPAPAGFWQVVGGITDPKNIPKGQAVAFPPTITFNPAAIPAGTELSIGVLPPSSGRQVVAFGLIDANSHTCTSTTADQVAAVAPWSIDWGVGQGAP
jgi:hypothetical protein